MSNEHKMNDWRQIPTDWITKAVLNELKWTQTEGSTNAAALMVYIALGAYTAPYDDLIKNLSKGEASPTYNELQKFCGLSRDLISKGIKKLLLLNLIAKKKEGVRTIYTITDLYTKPFGKIPYKAFAHKGKLQNVFGGLSVRNKRTLHALKIYFTVIKYRYEKTNYAHISYEKIEAFTGVPRFEIKAALCALTENKLLIIDMVPAQNNEYRQNIYRIRGVESTRHLATMEETEYLRTAKPKLVK